MTIEMLTASRPWLTAGWTMLHFLWVGGVLGLLAAAGRRALRGASPEVRYAFGLLSLSAMTFAPAVIALCLPAESDRRPVRAIPEIADAAPLPHLPAAMQALVPPLAPREPATLARRPAFDRPQWRSTLESWLRTAAAGLPWLWIAGTPATFVMLAAGLVGAERLRRRGRPLLDRELTELVQRLAGSLGIVRPVALSVCDRLAAPILLGVVRPLILLPAAAVTGWGSDQIEMALLHELAHVRRLDNLVNLAQRVIESLLFFHPAVWWVSGWVRLEREHCCDRLVVARTGRARPYAKLLAELAMHGDRPGRAVVAMAESPIVVRIRGILNPEEHFMPLSRSIVVLAAALLVAPAVLIAASQVSAPAPGAGNSPQPIAKEASQKSDQAPDRARIEELIRRARHGADMFQGIQERVYTLMQIAGVQDRTGDREAARRTFREAEQLAETVSFDDCTYSPHILHWIVQSEAKHGFRDEAIAAGRKLLRIAEVPIKREIKKMSLYSNLLRTQAELGDQAGVQETLQAGRRFFTTSQDPAINGAASVYLVLMQAYSGDLVGAVRMTHDPELFKEQKQVKPSNLSHNALFTMLHAIGPRNQEGARPILEEALKAAQADHDPLPWLDLSIRNERLQSIAEAQTRLGLFDDALKSARMIDSDTIPGHLADARKSDFRDQQRWRKAMTLAHISQEQAKAGDQPGTWLSAKEAARIVEGIEGDQYKYPVRLIAEALARIGKTTAARQVADLLKPDRRISAYEVIASTLRSAGDDAGARSTVEAAADLVRRQLDEVKAGFRDVDSPQRSKAHQLLESLGRIHAKIGDHKRAIETVRQINDNGRAAEALQRVASDLASAGDLDGALEAVGEINSPKSEAEALKGVIVNFSHREPGPPAR
jgi:beta-lactamase regulating signal transducer with metallopeptidase domain/tetratricopeptide (TPR) repeat protein